MNIPHSIPKTPGTYILLFENSLHRQIQIGKRGVLILQAGWYFYVGSAFGPGGLAARVGRNLKKEKTQRWHIDYLRAHVDVKEVWYSESPERLEHQWAKYFFSQENISVPQQGFSASDYQCPAHLFYSAHKPSGSDFSEQFSKYECRYCLPVDDAL